MKATISIFRMFVLVCGATYVEVHFNHSKFINFINSWKMVKNTKKLDSRFFSKKNWKENRGEIFCTFADMASLTLNSTILNSDQNPTSLCARLFINKNMP